MPESISLFRQCKPPLKWAGGKRWLVPYLMPLWRRHRHRRLVEPFCGGLAVALGLLPTEALLNDINPHAINFYRWLQRGFENNLKMENDEYVYYQYRKLFNSLIANGKHETKRAAELFYYLNRTGYNGLCRFNKQGEFNVPFGSYEIINYRVDFTPYREAFQNWVFTATDFDEVALVQGDFIYADPPYDVEFTQYAKEDFSWDDQVRLAEWLAQYPGPVVLSNQATTRIVKLYKGLGFRTNFIYGPRRISCSGDRTPAREVLATKGV